jgi:hypothetical protein
MPEILLAGAAVTLSTAVALTLLLLYCYVTTTLLHT